LAITGMYYITDIWTTTIVHWCDWPIPSKDIYGSKESSSIYRKRKTIGNLQ
jgi:hypothetical protein